jgi:DNA-binding transcriptional LysR family regulator
MSVTSLPGRRPSPDDLLVLLAVARAGRYTAAADELGLNHTTIARRIGALEDALGGRVLARGASGWVLTPLGEHAIAAAEGVERALGTLTPDAPRLSGVVRLSATDGFSGYIASPAIAEVRRAHPDVSLEIVAATRRAAQQRVGVDLEVVVGRPHVHRAEAIHLGDYALGLYASREFLAAYGTPSVPAELEGAPLVYFIESMLQVDALDEARRSTRGMVDAVSSTNVYVHVDATRAGAGFGLLPAFLADRHDDLVRLFADAIDEHLPYWLVCRPEALRQPTVLVFIAALRARIAAVEDELLGRTRRGSGGDDAAGASTG